MRLQQYVTKALSKLRDMQHLYYYSEAGIIVLEEDLAEFLERAENDFGILEEGENNLVEYVKETYAQNQYYVIEDKIKIGYLLKETSINIRKRFDGLIGVKTTETAPIHCSRCIHDADPLFAENEKLKSSKDEAVAAIWIDGNTEYQITLHALNQFYNRAHNAYDEMPGRLLTKRGALLELIELLKESVPVKRVNAHQQLMKHGDEARYLMNKKWIFVIKKEDNKLMTCYWKENAMPYFVE